MAKEFKAYAGAEAKVEYKKVRTVLEFDSKVFRPCEIKHFERGILYRQDYFIHYDGRRWDVLKFSKNEWERYIFE